MRPILFRAVKCLRMIDFMFSTHLQKKRKHDCETVYTETAYFVEDLGVAYAKTWSVGFLSR